MNRLDRAALFVLVAFPAGATRAAGAPMLPSVEEMAAAREDVWAEAAIRRPGGPSYEFFRDLLPPLRYVNAEFRHYPIVLSAPAGSVKARWISNGSGVNARANKLPMWREGGTPVRFLVGEEAEPFGNDLTRLEGPRYADGWLPIVRVAYRHGSATYEQEAFGPVGGAFAEAGTVVVRFTMRDGSGVVRAGLPADAVFSASSGPVRNSDGGAVVVFDEAWRWDGAAKELRAELPVSGSAVLGVATAPLASAPAIDTTAYHVERDACEERWREVLARGTRFDIPEPVVQDAWRALVAGQFLIADGDRMNYSAGNAYDHLYESECGDAVRSLLLYGQEETARRMVGPLLDFDRRETRFHVAGHKLQLLADYYWRTRDADLLRKKEPVWKAAAAFVVSSRQGNGLLPADNYAGDVKQQVISLSSNASCWRGLRDLSAVLADMGEPDVAATYAREAAEFRAAILAAVEKSERRDADPPFIPIALLGDEPPHDPLTATRVGSYYDLMAPYVIGAGVFGPGSKRETWMIDYLRRHGGIAMGMIRSMPHQGEFAEQPGVNPLYGLRYTLALLRRDDHGHALAAFYGQLAQGMTRDTYIGGEGSRFLHGDSNGRSFYLPPNSASNAAWLITLRNLLVQDWDLDDDGRPETLRLLYGSPRRWLEDGKTVSVERAPTAFGPVSFGAESRLASREIVVTIDPPSRRPDVFLLRPALPEGWRLASAAIEGAVVTVEADGGIRLPDRSGSITVRFRVEPDTARVEARRRHSAASAELRILPSGVGSSTPSSRAMVGATSRLDTLPTFAPARTPWPETTSVPSRSGWSGR